VRRNYIEGDLLYQACTNIQGQVDKDGFPESEKGRTKAGGKLPWSIKEKFTEAPSVYLFIPRCVITVKKNFNNGKGG
jgi:hypothetical protein